ncbi:MAG: protein of unknown function DUF302 [Magnetococcales bacterium]|nr:protein of unknown function DUF302 [Magnetococcales bacterium]HIJ83164.1 DUF302 domain-containing protein [Magnetococcales bacterium]
MNEKSYTIIQSVAGTFDEVLTKVRQGLMQQGFGILTEIDLSATFKNKLNVAWPQTIVLGACNPPLAHRAMLADPNVSVFLPCNVVVREHSPGSIEVAAINPEIIGEVMQNKQLVEVVAEVSAKMRLALNALG